MELHVPDFVGVAGLNIIRIVWCMQCMQFSQVISVLILESTKTLILQYYYMCLSFLTCFQLMFQFCTPWKYQWFIERATDMEYWLEIGQYVRINEGLWFLLCFKSQWNRSHYINTNLKSQFWIFMLCKCISISELWVLGKPCSEWGERGKKSTPWTKTTPQKSGFSCQVLIKWRLW